MAPGREDEDEDEEDDDDADDDDDIEDRKKSAQAQRRSNVMEILTTAWFPLIYVYDSMYALYNPLICSSFDKILQCDDNVDGLDFDGRNRSEINDDNDEDNVSMSLCD